MSHSFEAFFNADKNEPPFYFASIKELFKNNHRIRYEVESDHFSDEPYLNIVVDGKYTVGAFIINDESVESDFKELIGKPPIPHMLRMIFLFPNDHNNDFDDIVVILLDYMTKLKDVVVYSPTQEKIVFDASKETP
ncbi:MAG: hypothetical protein VX447_08820 [Pseudomonadota bacterium]|nr:hypothetical protein [Pseudomonadota bacterium]